MFNFASILEVGIGVYFLVGAIGGKYKIFSPKFLKEGKEALYKKILRIVYAIAALFMILLGVALGIASLSEEGSATFSTMSVIGTIATVGALTSLVAIFAVSLFFIDRKKKNANLGRSTAPRAAFYFDEDEKTNTK